LSTFLSRNPELIAFGAQKEVERRRRGNINEGINELGRIVPNGSGEKAKGAILSRAVQYIHHLKENEARNIEKWTLEKLLMDQAMGDMQAQLEEMRQMLAEERTVRQRLETELAVSRGIQTGNGTANANSAPRSKTPEESTLPAGKRKNGGATTEAETKRPRVEQA
jgi:transcriptional regulator CBF1